MLRFRPFGRLTINQGTVPRFGYAGYFYHAPSALDLTKFQVYDPDFARWESRDPRRDSVMADAYQYSADLINLYDPAGAAPIPLVVTDTRLVPGTGAGDRCHPTVIAQLHALGFSHQDAPAGRPQL
jgi:RHS repeat-associated protein